MLRAQVFNGIFRRPLERSRAYQKRIFRGDEDAKRLTIAYHVENILGDHGRLANHPDHGRPRRQNKTPDVMIFLDDAGICRPGHGTHCHGGIDRAHLRSLLAVYGQKLSLIRSARGTDLRRWHGMFAANGQAAA